MSIIIMVSGHIKDYDVFLTRDTVVVINGTEIVTKQSVPGLWAFVQKAKQLTIGWASFPDFEVIYLYDKADGNFGYAVNLSDPLCSEWRSAPFA